MLRSTQCCGLREIEQLSGRTPKKSMKLVCNDLINGFDGRTSGAFILFTGIKRSKYGEKFQEFIEQNELGEVIVTKEKKNPNSGNNLKVWVWAIEPKKLKKWYLKNK